MKHPAYEEARRDWLADRTLTAPKIAGKYGCSRRTAERWISRWLHEVSTQADERWMLRRILTVSETTLSLLRAMKRKIEEEEREEP